MTLSKYDTIVTSKGAAFNIYLHTFLYISFKLQAGMCLANALLIKLGLKHQGYSVTFIYVEVMINIVSQLNIFSVCLKLFLLLKNMYHKQIWIGTLQSIDFL